MPKQQRTPYSADAPRKGVYDPLDLVDLGFGKPSLIYRLVKDGDIPSELIGSNRKIPGTWVHERTGLG